MSRTSAFTAFVLSLASATALAENSATPAGAQLSEWAIDNAHGRVGFSVPHMVVSEVDGQFKSFSGKVWLDENDLTHSKLEFKADVASVDTSSADRDKHLKSPDFFDAEKFPTLQFASTQIKKSGKSYKITGDLTIHGVTKHVTLDATLSAPIANPWGKQVRAAHITGAVQRQDFGLSWNKALDKGGMLVGDTVSIDVKLELNK